MMPPIVLSKLTPARVRRQAALSVAFLFLLSLVPLWGLQFPPMQDYPQNLFQAKLTAEALSGQPLTGGVYLFHLKPTYSVFFLIVWGFQHFMPVVLAGKAAISIYFVLIGWAVWKTMWFTARDQMPGWGALLLFPAAYNQIYFLGFVHYLYAMPLLLVAILHLLRCAKEGWTAGRVLLHAIWLLVLLWVHPFAVGVYCILAATWTIPIFSRAYSGKRVAVGLGIAAALAILWVLPGIWGAAGSVSTHRITFDSPLRNASFLLYLFTGMNGLAKTDFVSLFLWLGAAGALIWSARGGLKKPTDLVMLLGVGAIVLILCVMFAPFSTQNTGYINVRIAFPLYLVLCVLAAVPGTQKLRGPMLVIAVLLMADSFYVQSIISRETAEIEPVIAAMAPDSTALPLLFNRDSAECDGYYFSVHLNDHFYYQIAKGGVTPYLFEAPAEAREPIYFRPGAQPPAPSEYFPTDFRWEKYGRAYRYFLVRGGNESVFAYMQQHAKLRVTSGEWRLYEKR